MPARKKAESNGEPKHTLKVLKEARCSTLSGKDKTQLTYQILCDDTGCIFLKITGNKGGGFWASENTCPYQKLHP